MVEKPNLLFIFTDEQRDDTLACYGNQTIQAPNLNRLADDSFVVDRAYCTQPVCTPSRSSIMTGYYPHTTGCLENNDPLKPEHLTLAERVPGDYTCTYYGKWHLGSELIAQRGFSEFVGIEDGYREHYADPVEAQRLSDYHHFLVEQGFEPDSGKSQRGDSSADTGTLRTFS
ncbi:MAG: sulfatase-like hydrolase/transferase, partial [Chloroflexota bacterium]|nr:sulfatase-like hydrolase/transferase [Chloroflexota bacterium]